MDRKGRPEGGRTIIQNVLLVKVRAAFARLWVQGSPLSQFWMPFSPMTLEAKRSEETLEESCDGCAPHECLAAVEQNPDLDENVIVVVEYLR